MTLVPYSRRILAILNVIFKDIKFNWFCIGIRLGDLSDDENQYRATLTYSSEGMLALLFYALND